MGPHALAARLYCRIGGMLPSGSRAVLHSTQRNIQASPVGAPLTRHLTSDETPRTVENAAPSPVTSSTTATANDWNLSREGGERAGSGRQQQQQPQGPVGATGVDRGPQVSSSPHPGQHAFIQETAGDAAHSPQSKMSVGAHSDYHAQPQYPPTQHDLPGDPAASGVPGMPDMQGRDGASLHEDRATPFLPSAAPAKSVRERRYVASDEPRVHPGDVGRAGGQEVVPDQVDNTMEKPGHTSSG